MGSEPQLFLRLRRTPESSHSRFTVQLLLDYERICSGLDAIDVSEAFAFARVPFTRIGDDAAVGGFEAPAPFTFAVFVNVEFSFGGSPL